MQEVTVDGKGIPMRIDALVIAGWTGRDRASVDHHIRELQELGVKPPRQVPMFYRVASSLLTCAEEVQVSGHCSSGEVEVALLQSDQGLLVGVASDHTDREVEAYGVTVSKQVCCKPISTQLWRFEDVADHWDQLVLRSYVTRNGQRTLYQEGRTDRMLAPADLIERFTGGNRMLPVGTVMFCGTLPALGKVEGGERFEIELFDPVRQRSIRHAYAVRSLPIVD